MNWNYQQQRFFVYDPEGNGMVYYDTMAERDAAAKKAVRESLCDDVWGEWIVNIVAGVVTSSAQKYDEEMRPDDLDEDSCDEEGTYWSSDVDSVCKYKMKPVVALRNLSDKRAIEMFADAELKITQLVKEIKDK